MTTIIMTKYLLLTGILGSIYTCIGYIIKIFFNISSSQHLVFVIICTLCTILIEMYFLLRSVEVENLD